MNMKGLLVVVVVFVKYRLFQDNCQFVLLISQNRKQPNLTLVCKILLITEHFDKFNGILAGVVMSFWMGPAS